MAHGENEARTWAEIEQAAQAGVEREAVALPPLRPVVNVEDPMLELVQMKVLRLAAEKMGIEEDPTWETTEAALGDQLHRGSEEPPPAPPAPPSR